MSWKMLLHHGVNLPAPRQGACQFLKDRREQFWKREHCKSGLFIVGFCTVVTGMFFLHSSSVFVQHRFPPPAQVKNISCRGQIAVVQVQISQLHRVFFIQRGFRAGVCKFCKSADRGFDLGLWSCSLTWTTRPHRVSSHGSAAVRKKEEEGAFFYESTSVFTPFIRVCGEGFQLSQVPQHHKSL